MKILFFGDIVGKLGREAVCKVLPQWKQKYQPDLIIANGENLAHGKGATENTLREIMDVGVRVITSGNHIFQRKENTDIFQGDFPLIRPLNYPPMVPGNGYLIMEVNGNKVLIFNLMGRVFIHKDFEDPFLAASRLIERFEKDIKIMLVDFHGEATSEKRAFGWYLNGRVSAVIGTHTHVPTADEQILSGGTAYITDVGMVGPLDSVISMEKEAVIQEYLTQLPQRADIMEEGEAEVNAVLIDIDEETGKARGIERLREIV